MTDQPISESTACSDLEVGQAPSTIPAASSDVTPDREPVNAPNPAPQQPALGGNGDRPFGAELEPVLRRTCNDQLSAINWFRTDWQRGGAATGYATFTDARAIDHAVVVKLPVQPRERLWLERLQLQPAIFDVDHPLADAVAGDPALAEQVVPTLFAHGDMLNGYDMAWIVMQRVPYGPLGPAWGPVAFDLAIEAAGRFYAAAARYRVDREPTRRDWGKILDLARQKVRRHNVAQSQRWNKALKKAQHKLPDWLKLWNDRPVDQWCHGDLHLGNAMSLSPAPSGPAVLLDLAEVHPGNWVEDAVYFEHLYWARRELLDGRKVVKAIAHERRQRGLPVEQDWPRLADVRRALLAMSTPAMLTTDGDPRHVQAALEVLEAQL